jgi:replicative DNA helicase
MSSLPHDHRAEAAVLSAVLLDPEVLPGIRSSLPAEAFDHPAHRSIYSEMLALANEDGVIDVIALRPRLSAETGLVLADVIDATPTAANVTYHTKLVRDRAKRRDFIRACLTAAAAAHDFARPADAIARDLTSILLPVAIDAASGTGYQRVRAVATLGEMERRASTEAGRVLTWFPEIDRETNGFRPGELVIVGGVPKGGKTAVVLDIARRNVFKGRGVGFTSAEMPATQITERILNAESGVAVTVTTSGRWSADQAAALADAARRLDACPLWIDDAAAPSLDDVIARGVALKAAHPSVEIIVVDFLQLVQHQLKGRRGDEELAAISYGLKSLAKRAECVVLAPCQLNYKAIGERPDQRPRLEDLAGGSGMLQAADFVALTYRPAMYNPTAPNVIELDFAACRRTSPFRVTLDWDGRHMRVLGRVA